MSIFVTHTNLVRIHGALRVTPAMEAGIASTVWSTEERVARALDAAEEPDAPPERKPLRLPVETPAAVAAAPARPLPNGGWLRLVTSSGEAPKAPPPAPSATPAALAAQAAPAEEPSGQARSAVLAPEARSPAATQPMGTTGPFRPSL